MLGSLFNKEHLYQKENTEQVFPSEYCERLKKSYFYWPITMASSWGIFRKTSKCDICNKLYYEKHIREWGQCHIREEYRDFAHQIL